MKKYYKSIVFALLFVALILSLKTVDVQDVGLAGLNHFVHNLIGVHMAFYNITDWIGVLAILIAFAFAVVGLVQLIKRKSIAKIDKEILALGGLYVAVIVLYLFFEKVIVNYRPIIMPGCTNFEASFPSSHTIIVCVIMGSATMVLGKYVKNTTLRKIAFIVLELLIALTVVGRLISGVHWFTDIIGGVLLSLSLLSLYSVVINN